jgi:hypothetical protein
MFGRLFSWQLPSLFFLVACMSGWCSLQGQASYAMKGIQRDETKER